MSFKRNPLAAAVGMLLCAGFASSAQAQGVLALDDMGLASFFADAGWFQVVGLCLLLGVLLTFTPCVLPMAPIVLAVVAGDARQRGKVREGGANLGILTPAPFTALGGRVVIGEPPDIEGERPAVVGGQMGEAGHRRPVQTLVDDLIESE